MNERSSQFVPRITFLASQVRPRYGMEHAVESVAELLGSSYSTKILAIGDPAPSGLKDIVSLGGLLHGYRRILSIPRLLRHWSLLNADVIVLVGTWAAVPYLICRRLRRSKAVVIVWEHSLMNERLEVSRKIKALALISDYLYRFSHAVVAVSPMLENDLRDRTRSTSVVYVPNPVAAAGENAQVATPRRRGSKVRIVSVGSLQLIKRHKLALLALSKLDERFTLTIIGGGPQREDLESEVKMLGLASRVRFTGYLGTDAVEQELVNHDLLLHCSAVETFGLVLVEAADAGLRVVVTRNRTSEWLVPQFVPGTVSSSDSDSLRKLLQIEAELQPNGEEFIESQRRRNEEFGDKRVLSEWRRVIEGALIDSKLTMSGGA